MTRTVGVVAVIGLAAAIGFGLMRLAEKSTDTVSVERSADQPEAVVPITHISPSPQDRFLECASRLLDKPILQIALPWISERVPCGSTRDRLEAALAAEQLQASDGGDWFVIHWSKSDNPHSSYAHRRYEWKRLQVVRRVRHGRAPEVGLPLSDEEANDIATRVLAAARPTLVWGVPTTPTEGARADVTLSVDVERVRLRPDVDSVVSLISSDYTIGRLVYGERRGSTYVPLWDSPLLATQIAGLDRSYRDLDGDGTSEILVTGFAHPYYVTLVAFDLGGDELTRQGDCPDYNNLGANATCPLIGEDFGFEPAALDRPFPLDIVGLGEQRYCLRSKRYVACPKIER